MHYSFLRPLLTAFYCFIVTLTLSAQSNKGGNTPVFTCGADIMLSKMRDNNVFRAMEAQMNKRILQRTATVPRGPLAPAYILPVVIHIINKDPNSITDADVQLALQQLNDAYGQTGAFAGARSDTKIQFCLAKTAPDGGKTTGILRSKSYLGDFDADMEGGDITNMGKWDGSRYINIWVVEDIRSEFMQEYECGKWRRLKMGGYASAGGDIVVAGLGVGVLAHEMGHYLSLLHTFAAMDCKNNNCATDGDMVCDTPPDRSINGGFACSDPENSCDTDTLSGFTTDVPDLPDNFMDYGGGSGCISSFTEGQAERMRNFIATSLPGMIGSTLCNEPCTAPVAASFTRDIDFPVTGNTVQFTNTSTGAVTYEWWVNNTLEATTTDFSLIVSEKKNYDVELRAFTATPGCFASFFNTVQVSCGVVARFYPDKRKIASKDGIELDSILFTNRSENATAFRWLMSNDAGMSEQSVSTTNDLKYIFNDPGTYTLRLEATNGTCTDTSNAFTFKVDDPTADGAVFVRSVDCYDKDKIRISLYFHNSGYNAFPINTPVTFYDKDPRLPGAQPLGSYKIPYVLKGKCTSYLETVIVDAGRSDFDTVVAVMNDLGSPLPVALPNTGFPELSYGNNFRLTKKFRFKAGLTPDEFTLLPDEQVILIPKSEQGGDITKATWSNGDFLSCVDCLEPVFTAPYRQGILATKKVILESKYGCTDSAEVKFHLPPVDDYTVAVKEAECAANDSVHVRFELCNSYAKGDIPAGVSVIFYDRDPALANAQQLGSEFLTSAPGAGICAEYNLFLKAPSTGRFYTVVNPSKVLPEADHLNNFTDVPYNLPDVQISPADTTVLRKRSYPLTFNTRYYTPVSQFWSIESGHSLLDCTTCTSPSITVMDTSMVKLALLNRFGCKVDVTALSNPLPPDMIIRINDLKCFDNSSTLVSFEVSMQNGFDSVYAGIPVSFYDADPSGGSARLLKTVYTSPVKAGEWVKYTTQVPTPAGTRIFARVNDNGPGAMPATAGFPETDHSNNITERERFPFTVTLDPVESVVQRPAGALQLKPVVSGGNVRQWAWAPSFGLSCINCEQPFINRNGSSMQYILTVTNEYYCTDTALFNSKTYASKRIIMPTAFSPNGDGVNDVFYVIGNTEIAMVKDFIIFDRWGTKVFEVHDVPANDRHYGWDGLVGGAPSSGGAYVYFVNILLQDGTVEMFKNSVIIVR